MCDCIDQMDKFLAEHNTMIDCAFNLFDKTLPATMVKIATTKKDAKVRGKPTTLIPSYCPFCGKKYTGKDNGAMLKRPATRNRVPL